jgi:group I intron endonuclease
MENHNNYPTVAGIYKLTCRDTGKIYVGKAINLFKRLKRHKNNENKLIGKCYFENVIKKYGWASFDVEILETFDNFDMKNDNLKILEKEANYIKLFDSTNPNIGYNLCKYSNDRTGVLCSAETKLKISQANKGKPKSREAIEKMRQSKLGKSNGPHTEETKERMRRAKLGKQRAPFTEEAIENMIRGQAKRAPMSEETKNKISLSSKGKPKSREAVEKMRQTKIGSVASAETKEKMSLARRGKLRDLTEEAKESIRRSNRERIVTAETREKMRNSRLAYIAKI